MANGYIDALKQAQRTISTQRQALLVVAAVALVGMYLVKQVPVNLTIHPAPNMRAGDVIQVQSGMAPVPAPNVYGFAIYIWQQINRWGTDGSKDYGTQLFTFQNYLTPNCLQQIQADIDEKSRAGELSSRTRSMGEIPGQVFTEDRVVPEGEYAWNVILDLQLQETVRGLPVKDVYVRYPLRVVRFDVDREKNLWGLALDCYGSGRPQRLDPNAVKAAITNRTVVKTGPGLPAQNASAPATDREPVQIGAPAAAHSQVPGTAPFESPSSSPTPAVLPSVQ